MNRTYENELSQSRIKDLTKLQQKKYRELEGLVVVEGFRTLEHLLDHGIELEEVYFISEKESQRYLLRFPKSTAFIRLNEHTMGKICDTNTPQGIAALVKTKITDPVKPKAQLYLDALSDPGNLGTIIRTAYAAGWDSIVLSPKCCELFNPKVIRSSTGTVFTMPIQYGDYQWLKNQKAEKIITVLENGTSYKEYVSKKEEKILIIGSEAHGITQEIQSIADIKLTIPMVRAIDSLNASVATGILLYSLSDKI